MVFGTLKKKKNWVFQGLSFSSYGPVLSLCISWHLLKEEASLIMAEWGTDGWVEYNVLRDILLLCFFSRTVALCFPPRSQVHGCPSSVKHGFHPIEWALSSIRQLLSTTDMWVPLLELSRISCHAEIVKVHRHCIWVRTVEFLPSLGNLHGVS